MLKQELESTRTTADALDLNTQIFKRTETDIGQLEAELETISRLLNVFENWFYNRGRISDRDRTATTHELNRLWDEAPDYYEVLFATMRNVRELCKEMNEVYEKLDG